MENGKCPEDFEHTTKFPFSSTGDEMSFFELDSYGSTFHIHCIDGKGVPLYFFVVISLLN